MVEVATVEAATAEVATVEVEETLVMPHGRGKCTSQFSLWVKVCSCFYEGPYVIQPTTASFG